MINLEAWIISKLKTMVDYYQPPNDGRDTAHEIMGWMHVLCFHYEQNRREVKEYDAARRAAKELTKRAEAADELLKMILDGGALDLDTAQEVRLHLAQHSTQKETT